MGFSPGVCHVAIRDQRANARGVVPHAFHVANRVDLDINFRDGQTHLREAKFNRSKFVGAVHNSGHTWRGGKIAVVSHDIKINAQAVQTIR